jgi:hypothetical protein
MQPPETKKQKEARKQHNDKVLQSLGLPKNPKPDLKPKPEGKVLSFSEKIQQRLCTNCYAGNLQEIDFNGKEHLLKCSICGFTINTKG